MREKEFWNFASDAIDDGEKIVLLKVADATNSSPGRQGFQMLLKADGVSMGTIGGGIMEKEMIDYSLSLLAGTESKLVKRLQHSPNTKYESSGLICGGLQTIVFQILSGSHRPVIKKILTNLEKRIDGTMKISCGNFSFDAENSQSLQINFTYSSDDDWAYTENVGFSNTVYIIGGGHVGKAVSDVMKQLGFYVTIFDHRNDVFTMKDNLSADEKIITDYKNTGNYIIENEKSYIVIATPRHNGDRDALISVLGKNVKYVGMMGSKKKIHTIFEAVREAGYSDETLFKVHSPIGLEIEAETPEEIAISIAAEIIKIKNAVKNVR